MNHVTMNKILILVDKNTLVFHFQSLTVHLRMMVVSLMASL